MEKNQYPITFIDYIMVVPMPGIIMLDEEISAEQLFVRDGDIFKVVIDEGKIRFVGVSRAPQ